MHDLNEKTQIITDLLSFIGEDITREGLQETPLRVLKAWKEKCSGYEIDIPSIFKVFEDGAQNYDEMIIVDNIPLVSVCEHHMENIVGVAHIAYVPNGKIVGLSKFVRLVEAYSRRLQVQERLTNQIATAIEENLQPKGVGVIIKASHGCMEVRGVRSHGVNTTTSAMRGVFIEKDNNARLEFLNLISK
jgi:GTP cyclohydrolase I